MLATAFPLSGFACGQMVDFHGIWQRSTFPVYITPDYEEAMSEIGDEYPYQSVVVAYDGSIPNIARFADDISSIVGEELIRLPLKAGEDLKTPGEIDRVAKILKDRRVGEKSIMLVIGGGTLSNFAGFLSSVWSGMEPVMVPTNYTAIADVAVGSLHMLNVGSEKNRIQLYHDPLAVILDSRFMKTLPSFERKSGLVETVKHGMAQESGLLGFMEGHLEKGTLFDDDVIFDLALKTARLKDDLQAVAPFSPHTQHILLYGHTIAHAIEPATAFRMSHCEAVSLGLLAELAFFHDSSEHVYVRIKSMLDALGLPTRMPDYLSADAIVDQLRHVMNSEGRVAIPRVENVGELSESEGGFAESFGEAEIRDAIAKIQ